MDLLSNAAEYFGRPVWTRADATRVIDAIRALGFSIIEVTVYGKTQGIGFVEAREYPYAKKMARKSAQASWGEIVKASSVEANDFVKGFCFHEKDSTLSSAEPGFSFTTEDESQHQALVKKGEECECARLPKKFDIVSFENLKEIREILSPYMSTLHFEGLCMKEDLDGVEIRPITASRVCWLEEDEMNFPDTADLIMTCNRCAAQYQLHGDFYHGSGGEFRQIRIPLRRLMTPFGCSLLEC